jgi:HAD superfamily phosphatase (TIGR01668 family)
MGIFDLDILRPDRYVSRIEQIDLDELKRQGIRCILFDRDNTVVPRTSKVAPPEVLAWFERAQSMGIECYMVSNNFHRDRVMRSASELGVDGVHAALKPFPSAFRRAFVASGVPAEQTVMIGDQVFTDVLGGNLAGAQTILVRPQCDVDLFGMAPIRWLEDQVNKDAVYEGEESHER